MTTIISLIKRMLGKKPRQQPLAGNTPKSAVIPRSKHTVSKTDISANALKVLNRLHGHQFEAHLVGGGVRDLLLKHTPKDFDIATNAHPNEVRKLFKNSRLIGRRFRLAHILFYRDVIEVATFRASSDNSQHEEQRTNHEGMIVRDNVYGTISDDVWRRDFTINALYYNIADSSIIDFTGGFNDLKAGIVRIIGSPIERYTEDPVRMLRAVRFCAKLDFELEAQTAAAIKPNVLLLQQVSNSRLFEEVSKLYHCGKALQVQALLTQYGLFDILFPYTADAIEQLPDTQQLINHMLENTDQRILEQRPVTPAFFFAVMLWQPLQLEAKALQQSGIPPLPALEKAMNIVLGKQSKIISIPKRFTASMREMWLLQYRFEKRHGQRASRLIEHPRFRAAYDILLLRAMINDAPVELAEWWTTFQEETDEGKLLMVKGLSHKPKKRRRGPRKKATAKPIDSAGTE